MILKKIILEKLEFIPDFLSRLLMTFELLFLCSMAQLLSDDFLDFLDLLASSSHTNWTIPLMLTLEFLVK